MPKQKRFWSTGLEKITNQTHGEDVKTDQEASNAISDALNTLLTGIISKMKEDDHKNASVEGIQDAVKKLLPTSMADHAMAEGFREIFSYNAMPFDFAPKKKLDEKYVQLLEKMKKQDEVELKRSYMSAVNDVMKNSHADARLDKNSNLYICRILDGMSNEMIKRLNAKNANKLTLEEAKKISDDILPDELAHHAAAEGHKMLFKFESRGLHFVPGATARQRVQEKLTPHEQAMKYAKNGIEFKSGATSILKETHPSLKYSQSGQKLICQNLDSLCEMIMEKSGKKGTAKTQGDIEKAVQTALPPVMAEHAIAEAKKMLKRYEYGEMVKIPGVRRGEKAKIAAQKRKDLKLEEGVVSIAKMTYPKARMKESAINRISADVNGLLRTLIKKVKDSGVKNVTPEDIKKAVDAIIVPTSINEHAISEGDKMVTVYEMDKFIFRPKKRNI